MVKISVGIRENVGVVKNESSCTWLFSIGRIVIYDKRPFKKNKSFW